MSRWTARNFKYCDSDFMDSGLGEPINKLAHYEDLEEQGRLIELPCKVGTPIYYLDWEYDELNDKAYFIGEDTFCIEDLAGWGEYHFLTKEEAEAKLEEMKGEKI